MFHLPFLFAFFLLPLLNSILQNQKASNPKWAEQQYIFLFLYP